jgi:hypothetical protein
MNDSTRSRALRAAAKLATAVALTGCGGLQSAESTQTDSGAISADSSPRASSTSTPACSLTTNADGGLLASEVQCCLDLTSAQSPTDGDASAWRADPSLSGCCHGLAQSFGLIAIEYEDAGGRAWSDEACQSCAETIGTPSACTPWGPPVPPAMPSEMVS